MYYIKKNSTYRHHGRPRAKGHKELHGGRRRKSCLLRHHLPFPRAVNDFGGSHASDVGGEG